jgi:RNA polymerase sigma-70 factor (ECF subfamily)
MIDFRLAAVFIRGEIDPMADLPMTRASLLVRLRSSADGAAWSQFVDLYAPVIYGFARGHGLQDADAADLTQEVLRAVSAGIGRLDYDPQRGTFRGWLFTVVRNKLRDFLSARSRQVQGSGDTDVHRLLQELPGREAEQEAVWLQEYEQQLFTWAAEQVRRDVQEATWCAFWQTAVEGKSGKEVASALGMSVAAVYLAKGRVLARLHDLVQQVRDDSI